MPVRHKVAAPPDSGKTRRYCHGCKGPMSAEGGLTPSKPFETSLPVETTPATGANIGRKSTPAGYSFPWQVIGIDTNCTLSN